jgi:hypothetical protein
MDSSGAAELLLTIGSVLEQNRMAGQAETLYRAALAIRQLAGKGERAEGAAAVSALGMCRFTPYPDCNMVRSLGRLGGFRM